MSMVHPPAGASRSRRPPDDRREPARERRAHVADQSIATRLSIQPVAASVMSFSSSTEKKTQTTSQYTANSAGAPGEPTRPAPPGPPCREGRR